MKRRVFYMRSGQVVSRHHVRHQRLRYANSLMTWAPETADLIENMSEEDFADWSGSYTFKDIEVKPKRTK